MSDVQGTPISALSYCVHVPLFPDEWISACTEFILEEQNLLGRGYALTTQQVSDVCFYLGNLLVTTG